MNDQKYQYFEKFFNSMGKIKRYMDQKSNTTFQDRITSLLQLNALTYVKDNPLTTVGALAKHLVMSSSSTAQLIDRLLLAQWIERRHDDEDKRIVHLLLTTSGEKKLTHLQAIRRERVTDLSQYISEHDLKELVRIMEMLSINIEKKGTV